MIPMILHYFWFGGNPKPPIILRCIESWKKHCPGYLMIEWNESNYDINKNPYIKQAYEAKKFAYVTDYARLDVLYRFGGMYLDADVEIVKPLDGFLSNRAFTGHETKEKTVTAIMGSEPGHPWVKMLLDYYDSKSFNVKAMTPNTDTITELSAPWVVKEEGDYKYLRNEVVIYPVNTFCSFDHKKLQPIITPEAYTYHMFAGSWVKGGRNQARIAVQ